MKNLILIIIAIFSLQINHSQNLSIESNLDGLILNIGDTFQAESYISDLDGDELLGLGLDYDNEEEKCEDQMIAWLKNIMSEFK